MNPADARIRSQNWLNQQVKSLGKPKASSLMRTGLDRDRSIPHIGNMYFFYYNAKHRATLPFWDKFPLVIPFTINPDGFTGLNFHYLPFGARIYLLDSMLSIYHQKLDDKTQLKVSWAKIKSISKLNFAEQCVHRYLSGYIMSPLKMIEPQDWQTALALNVQQFVGPSGKRISPHRVWS